MKKRSETQAWANATAIFDTFSNNQNLKERRRLRANRCALRLLALRPRLSDQKHQLFSGLAKIGVLAFIFSFVAQNAYVNDASAAASLTLTVPSKTLSVAPDPNSNNGFAKSENSSISITSSGANWGYSLSIKSKENTNTLKNGSNAIESISADLDEETFKTDASYKNKWGYLPSKLNGAENTKYKAGPTSETVIEKTNESTSAPNSYSIGIAAKVDSSLSSGNYINTFVLSATANTVSYNITYNLNSGSWSGTSPQTGSTVENSIKLSDQTPTRGGYEFKGWCTTSTTNESCSGTTYQPGASIDLSSSSNNLTLWAMWQSAGRRYTINYYSNVGSPSSMPSKQTGTALASNSYNVTISSTSPSLSGYTFMGWCSSSTSTESCSGTSYSAGGTWTVPSDNATLNLYAKWQEETGPGSCPKPVTSCSSGGYSGQRFGNGKCWMSSNFKTKVEWSSNFGCPSGWSTPTYDDFNSLISSSQAGSGACLYEQGWSGDYWSSTNDGSFGSSYLYHDLSVDSSSAGLYHRFSDYSLNLRCVSS